MKPIYHYSRGMLLIEVILMVALASFILASAATLYFVLTQESNRQRFADDVDTASADALLRIEQAVRSAQAVTEPPSGTEGDILVLHMRDTEHDPTTIWLSDGALMYREGANEPDTLLPTSVQARSLKFHVYAGGSRSSSVYIEFESASVNPGGRSEFAIDRVYTGTATTR